MKKGLKVEEAAGFYSESSGSPKRSGVAGSDVFSSVPHIVPRTTLR